jgi:DNA-binding CsgD family transcriptional regulator
MLRQVRPWLPMAGYGAALAAGTFFLQWIDYVRVVRSGPGEIYLLLVAAAFLGLGLWLGARLFGGPPVVRPEGNPLAASTLGISPRELEVLAALAEGLSTKEIAARFDVSPATIKTHVARLFEKLGARRRTEAIAKARGLGLLA